MCMKERTGYLPARCWRGRRAGAITSLIQSAKLNGHDPYAYLKDVLYRLPTQKDRNIDELLPHLWKPAS